MYSKATLSLLLQKQLGEILNKIQYVTLLETKQGIQMRTRTKILAGLAAAIIFVPFFIPVNSSGTLTKEQAAFDIWGDRSQFTELADHEVHFVTAGDPISDRLVILLHGFGASAFSWKYVLDEIDDSFVIAYDRAAFGFTERPATFDQNPYGVESQLEVIDGFIDLFGENKEVYLLGHSAGGSMAMAYAIENSERLTGLILEAPAIYSSGGGPSWLNWVFSIPQLDHLGPLLVSSIATSGLDLLYESYEDQSLVTDEILAGYTKPLEVIGWEKAFWEFNKATRPTGLQELIPAITLPVLVITGDNDTVVATEDSILLASELPNADLAIIENTGHLPNEEKPAEFAEILNEFLDN